MNSYKIGSARFSLLSEGAVRIEYAKDRAFLDEPTLFALRQSTYSGEFVYENGILTVKTPKLTLTYTGDGEEFSCDNLSVLVHTAGKKALWHFGDRLKNNLGSTLSTLDGVDGDRPLPDGILSRDGFYVIDDSGSAVLRNGWLEKRNEDHIFDLYFLAYGNDYKSALSDLAAISGKMELPRKCFMGSWYSRWWPYTADEFLAIADEYSENGFPLDIMVLDMDWHYQDWGRKEGEPEALYGYGHAGGNLGWTGYTWNRTLIPNPGELVEKLHERGLRVILNDHPCDGIRDSDEMYSDFLAELESRGYEESVLDISDKISQKEKDNINRAVKNFRFNGGNRDYMEAFFKSAHRRIEENEKIDFWWLDWQQDYIYPHVNGVEGTPHLPWLNYLYYENSKAGGKRGMSFSRFGGIGDHKHPAYFSGDATTTWDTLAFEIKMTATAGNIGCFWWSHDIGGFYDPVPGGQAECYVRWVQFGATAAALRLHVCGDSNIDRRPWTWDKKYCDAMREMFALRSRLIPTLYSLGYESYRDSVPFIRPLYIEYPETEEAYKHPGEYMLGENIISAPVTKPMGEDGKVLSELWLPDGIWFDYFSKERYEGGFVKIENSLSDFPLLVRAGYPLVTQPYRERMTSAPYSELIVEVFCDGNSSGRATLFEDDGVGEGYKFGSCRKTEFTFVENGGKYTVIIDPEGDYEGSVKERKITFVLKGASKVSSLMGGEGEVLYDEEKKEAKITLLCVDANKKHSFFIE